MILSREKTRRKKGKKNREHKMRRREKRVISIRLQTKGQLEKETNPIGKLRR